MQTSSAPAHAPVLKIGQKVPDFTAETTAGPLNFNELNGRMVVLYFYPKDSTPGCTNEASDFAAAWQDFLTAGAEVYGISRDSLKSHANFRQKLELPFALVSDPDEALCTLFDVIRLKNMYGKQVRGIERSTFLINRAGVLVKEWRKVKVPGHVAEAGRRPGASRLALPRLLILRPFSTARAIARRLSHAATQSPHHPR